MSILDKILAHKREEIAALDTQALRRAANASPAPRDFLAALKRRLMGAPFGDDKGTGVRVSLIAELKRASPIQRDSRPAP